MEYLADEDDGLNTCEVLIIVARESLSFSIWRLIENLNKEHYFRMTDMWEEFYSIPHFPVHKAYSELQMRLLERHQSLLLSHSSWREASIVHGYIPSAFAEESNTLTCKQLSCPSSCSILDQKSLARSVRDTYRSLMLKVPGRGIERNNILAQRKILLDSIPTKDIISFLPHFARHCDPQELLDLVKRLHGYSMYELYYLVSYIRGTDIALRLVPSSVRKNLLKPVDLIYSWATQMLRDPKQTPYPIRAELDPFVEFVYSFFSGSRPGQQRVVKTRSVSLIETSTILIKICATINKPGECETRDYLLLDSGCYQAYIISKCLSVIGRLAHLDITAPRALMGDRSVIVLELPAGSTISDFRKECQSAGSAHAVEPSAVHVALSYLLGLDGKYLGYCRSTKGFFHVDYCKIYYKDRMRLASIIDILGGRSSSYYKQFEHTVVRYCMVIRQYYNDVLLFLALLRIRQDEIESRFVPRLSDEDAEKFYRTKLEEGGNAAVKAWRYLGY